MKKLVLEEIEHDKFLVNIEEISPYAGKSKSRGKPFEQLFKVI